MSPTADDIARAANAPAAPSSIAAFREYVTAAAVGATGGNSRRPLAAQRVLPAGNHFEMLGIYAGRHAAEVIDNHPFGDGATSQLHRYPVGRLQAGAGDVEAAVVESVITADPQPAACIWLGKELRSEAAFELPASEWV